MTNPNSNAPLRVVNHTTPGDIYQLAIRLGQVESIIPVVAPTVAALQAAINAADARGGGIVTLPAGSDIAFGTTTVSFPVSQNLVLVEGNGSQVTYSGAGYAFDVSDGGATATWFKGIQNLDIVGTAAAAGLVRFRGSLFGSLIRCRLRGATAAGSACVLLENNTSASNYFNRIEQCDIRQSAYGIRLESDANSNYFSQNHFGIHATYAIQIDGGDTNVVRENEFNGSITTAIRLVNAAVSNKILFNQFDGPATGVSIASAAVLTTVLEGNTGAPVVGGAGTTSAQFPFTDAGDPGFVLGGDITLYRYAAAVAYMLGELRTNAPIRADWDSAATQVAIGGIGPGSEAAVLLNDITLYRLAAAVAHVDAELRLSGVVSASWDGGATAVVVTGNGVGPGSEAGVSMGTDTVWYRAGANLIATPDDVRLDGKVGFNTTAPIAKPTVTGSRVANPALASLLTALANYGLITDSTTA